MAVTLTRPYLYVYEDPTAGWAAANTLPDGYTGPYAVNPYYSATLAGVDQWLTWWTGGNPGELTAQSAEFYRNTYYPWYISKALPWTQITLDTAPDRSTYPLWGTAYIWHDTPVNPYPLPGGGWDWSKFWHAAGTAVKDAAPAVAAVALLPVAAGASAAASGAQGAVAGAQAGATAGAGAAVAGGAAAAAGVKAAATAGAGAAVQSGSAAASSATQAATSGAADATSGAWSSIESAGTGVINKVGGLVDEISHGLQDALAPIEKGVGAVTGLFDKINSGILQPIQQGILEPIKAGEQLVSTITSDLHGGINGLLQIPQDITNALDSIDASMGRAMSMLGTHLLSGLPESMGPAMENSGARPLGALHELFTQAFAPQEEARGGGEKIHLGQYGSLDEIEARMQAVIDSLRNAKGFFGTVLHLVGEALFDLPALAGMILAGADLAKEVAMGGLEAAHLAEGNALTAWMRGIIDDESLKSELMAQGYDATRRQTLKDLMEQLPSPGDVIGWERRGLIDKANRDTIMKRQGWRGDNIDLLDKGSLTLTGIQDALHELDREALTNANIAVASLTQEPDERLQTLGRALGLDPTAITTQVRDHWQIPGLQLILQGYYRNLLSREQLNAFFRYYSFPPELWDDIVDFTRPLIEYRTVATLAARGVLTDQDAISQMLAHGYTQSDAELMLKYAHSSAKPAHTATASALHGLTAATIESLYTNGAIDRATAEESLTQLGLSEEAVKLNLELIDIKESEAEKTAQADHIVELALAGLLDFESAQGALATVGLSTLQTEKYLNKILRLQRTKTKLPSLADVEKMWKKGIIDEPTLRDTIGVLGYSATWADRMVQLITGGGTSGANTGGATTANSPGGGAG